MSDVNRYQGDLALLIEALFEGTLGVEEAERVTRAVMEDPEAADLYWDYVELHTELRRMYRNSPSTTASGPASPIVPDATVPGTPLADSVQPPSPPATGGLSGTLGMIMLGLGGVLVTAVIVAAVGLFGPRYAANSVKPASIAKVTAVSAGTAADVGATDACQVGLALAPGQCVSVQSGSVQLTYDNGVLVTLTGPASYRLIDRKYGFLQEGAASARVPAEAVGFTINTPAGGIIDCGTEFDVTVGKDAKTGVATADVRVIDGAVDINVPASPGTGTEQRRFKAGEALRMSSLNNGSSRSKSSDMFDPRTVPGLRLWLNADAGVLRGPDNRVTEVIDLVGDANATAENARQPAAPQRPRWLSATINNRPTLVFEGRQYIQLPSQSDLNFEDESLSIFVVGNASGGAQYFLSSRVDGENRDPRGFRFTSSLDGGLRYQAAGVTVVQPCDTRQHAVFSVIHDRRTPGANTVTLFRNGRQLGPVAQVSDSDISNAFPLTIGANLEAIRKYPKATKNYLRGELGEILIFDRVLTPEQRGQIESYLIRKYGFDPSAENVPGVGNALPGAALGGKLIR